VVEARRAAATVEGLKARRSRGDAAAGSRSAALSHSASIASGVLIGGSDGAQGRLRAGLLNETSIRRANEGSVAIVVAAVAA